MGTDLSVPLKSPDPINGLNIEQELRQTIQHLAIQNMYLARSQNETKSKLLQQQSTPDLQLLNKLQKQEQEKRMIEISRDKALSQIEELESDKTEGLHKIEILTAQLQSLSYNNESADFTSPNKEDDTVMIQGGSEGEADNHVEKNRIDMEKFKEDLSNKREARHRAISAVSSEMERLRYELNEGKLARNIAEHELEEIRKQIHSRKSVQECPQFEKIKEDLEDVLLEKKNLESEKEDLANRLREEQLKFESEQEYSKRRIGALKEVAALSKQMLSIRENQVTDLKEKIRILEATRQPLLVDNTQSQEDNESKMNNLKSLKSLYEDRMKIVTNEKENLARECEEKSDELSILVSKCSTLESKLLELEKSDSELKELNISLQTRLDLSLEESQNLSKEIALINSMFTQMLVGNNSTDIDLDKLTRLLQENHDLITEMTTKEDGSDTAASLPKLLLDLVNQIDNDQTASTSTEVQEISEKNEDTTTNSNIAVEEIASNLPKVWRVLMELLSHHVTPSTPADLTKPSCYKCIETPTGPQFVPSVSNTYIRLKDLILEKKSLQKDLGKLKQLNGHLESKLHEQEKRLTLVSAELRKTWGVVGRLRSQFRQLHTHEQILRYELQQKRHLLTELKNELEYCREKWERARAKDLQTEIEWKKLRKEFAERKQQGQNNSGESGFSDERENESGDESNITKISESQTLTKDERMSESQTLTKDEKMSEIHALTKDEKMSEIHALTKDEIKADPNNITSNSLVKGSPEVSLVSWMTLLKLQMLLNCNYKIVQTESERLNDAAALESIFSKETIKIPESILKKIVCSTDDESHSDLQNTKEKPSPAKPETPDSIPSTSFADSRSTPGRDALGRTPEEALAARAARLNRLEEQTQLLFKKVTRTTNRSVALSNRLEELHEQYGVPNPPPLPHVLPALRIPLEVESNPIPNTENPDLESEQEFDPTL